MSLFDNLLNQATEQIKNVQNDVQKYLTNKITEPLVKVGALPTGNLSQAQIQAGMRGTPAPIAPPQAPPETIARSEGSGMSVSLPAGLSVPVIVGLGVVAFLLFRKKG